MPRHEVLENPDDQYRYEERFQELGGQYKHNLLAHIREDASEVCRNGQLAKAEHFITLVVEVEGMACGFCVAGNFPHDQFGVRFDLEPEMNNVRQAEYAFQLRLEELLVQRPEAAGQTRGVPGFNHHHAIVNL
mgnify:CR=1 FL=1